MRPTWYDWLMLAIAVAALVVAILSYLEPAEVNICLNAAVAEHSCAVVSNDNGRNVRLFPQAVPL